VGLLPESVTATRDAVSHRSDHQYLHRRFNGFVDVRDYGAVGDDTTDDTTAINQAYTATPIGGQLYFPPNYTFKITTAITLSKAIQVSGYASVMHQVTSGGDGILITASGVEVRGLALQGPQTPGSIVYNGAEDAIVGTGASAAAPLTSFVVADCEIYGWGDQGVSSYFVNGANIENNYIHDIGYAGISMLSPQRGRIVGNRIITMGPGTVGNCYGIAVTRNSTASLVTDPRATNVTISENTVDGVPIWEGIDTHGGQGLKVLGNTILNCLYGINMTICPFGAAFLAPIDCVIDGNFVDSTVTNGSRSFGISFGGDATEYATGIVSNNIVVGCGDVTNSWSGGITLSYSRGLTVTGNRMRDCSPNGIAVIHDNLGASVMGNVTQDAWANSGSAYGVTVPSSPNSGYVEGNLLVRGSKSATVVNTAPTFVNTGNTITSGTNLSF
jgi:hypothetical protein